MGAKREGGQGGEGVANHLIKARAAAEKNLGAEQVDADEGEGNRQADHQQGGQRAEHHNEGGAPDHVRALPDAGRPLVRAAARAMRRRCDGGIRWRAERNWPG